MVAVQCAIGAIIRRERQLREWRLLDLAGRTGLSVVYLGEIERGKKYPSAIVLEKIAAALEIALPDLFALVADELRGDAPIPPTKTFFAASAPYPGAASGETVPTEMETLLRRLAPGERRTLADLGAFLLARHAHDDDAR